jgi:Surface antigen variable number repeat
MYIYVFVCAAPAGAQATNSSTRCFEGQDYWRQVRAIHAKLDAKMDERYPPAPESDDVPRIIFDKIALNEDSQLSPADRQRLVEALNGLSMRAEPGWTERLQEHYVAGFLQDRGYYHSQPRVLAESVRADTSVEHVALSVHLNEGQQYRMGQFSFQTSDPEFPLIFTNAELQSRYYLRRGDILDASKIRASIHAWNRLYGAHGYIDCVVGAVPAINEETHAIDLIFDFDRQKQFHIDKVTVETMRPEVRAVASRAFEGGSVFNLDEVTKFLKDNTALLPPDISLDDVELRRNVNAGTVDITLHLAPCPQLDN